MRGYAEALETPVLGQQPLRGYLTGSVDVVLRLGERSDPRYVIVDYKTNWLGPRDEPLTAHAYRPAALDAAMAHSDYPLQALLYAAVLHRFLRWRQPGYDPERHLGGVVYLYLRGMCGPDTPRVDGEPCGVFTWRPPVALLDDLSDLLDGKVTTMTEIFEPVGDFDRRVVLGGSGLLGTFNEAGVLEAADVHVASRLGDLAGLDPAADAPVLLAVALAVRAVRAGSVCVDLTTVAALAPDLAWPEPVAWAQAVAASTLARQGVVHLEGDLVYLDRYHRLETQVCADLLDRVRAAPPEVDEAALAAALAAHQRRAPQRRAVARPSSAPCGSRPPCSPAGPAPARPRRWRGCWCCWPTRPHARGERLSIALAAPTGKAATRLQEAVAGELAGLDAGDRERVGRPEAMTLHRLLGWRFDNQTRFRHDRTNRLKYDLVVVDETSMVELTMMGRLLEAMRPQSRLVLVGDPRQLTSVGAGAVLSDIVAGFDGPEGPGDPGRREPGRVAHEELPLDPRHPRALRGAAGRRPRRGARPAAGEQRGGRVRRDRRPRTRAARGGPDLGAGRPGGCRGRRPAGRRRRARPAPPALCPPRGTPRRTPLEQAGRAVGDRGDRPARLRRVVRRPAAAGDRQRLHAGDLQRRDRGRGAPARRTAACLDLRLGDPARLRARAGSTPSRRCTR